MEYILGVDGGNSKTYAVIVDRYGNRVGHGMSGNGNHQAVGVASFLKTIQSAIHSALSEANLQPDDIDTAQFGLAGADRKIDFHLLHRVLSTLPYDTWNVVPDTLEGLRAGSMTNTGAVLVCGAGTNAAGRNEQGLTVQTGGFGYRYGDAAGGAFLALQAFRAAIRGWEQRGSETLLTEMVPKDAHFKDIEAMFHHYIDSPKQKLPFTLTKTLHQAAELHDAVAINILKDVGYELGLAANSVVKRLGGFEAKPIPVVLIGSVLQKGQNVYLMEMLRDTIQKENPSIKLINLEMEPVYGAILLGMDYLKIEVTDEMLRKFRSFGGY